MKYILKTTYHIDDITNAIQKLESGDELVLSSGTFYTAPWDLKSDIIITLEKGTRVFFTHDKSYYNEKRFIRFEGVECYGNHPLIYARDCMNITIQGEGELHGNGVVYYTYKKLQKADCAHLTMAEYNHISVEDRVKDVSKTYLRPDFIEFVNCENVLLKDFKIFDSPMWTIHPVYCKNVSILNLTISSDGPNTDGIDPDSCDNVLIEKNTFLTGDDCIAINSGLNEDGIRVGIPCTRVVIRKNKFLKGHAAIAIGSGMSGGVEDIHAYDNVIDGVERGIRIKSMPGRGGYVKNVLFEDMTIKASREGIELTMDYPSSSSEPATRIYPHFSDFKFKNIEILNSKVGLKALGLEDNYIANVELDNVVYESCERETDIKYTYILK